MNRWLKFLVVPVFMLFLFTGEGWALSLDGNMGDWTALQYTDGEESPYNNNGYLNPGWGGQSFDVEKIGFFTEGNTAYFGLQTGFDFTKAAFDYLGQSYYAGDIFIDFGKDGNWDIAIDISGTGLNSIYDGSSYSLPIYGQSAPYLATNRTVLSSLVTSSSATIVNGINETSYGIEGSFDLTLSPAWLEDFNEGGATIHWTMSCGNDVLEHQAAAPVPEPATMLLLGTGLIGLAGASRKKFKK